MADYLLTILALFFSLIFFFGIFFLFLRKPSKLDPKKTKKYIQQIKDTRSQAPSHSLINSHKIFIAAITSPKDKKHTTAAKKIKEISKKLPNEKKIWHFHRLRNQAAHEIEFGFTKAKAQEAREQFVRALKSLM